MPLTAGLLLAAGEVVTPYGLPWPNDDEIFAATNSNRAGAREIEEATGAFLPALSRSPSVGRELLLVAHASEVLRLLGMWEDFAARAGFATTANTASASNADEPPAAKHDATPA